MKEGEKQSLPLPFALNSNFMSYFLRKYNKTKSSESQRNYVIKNYTKDYYDHLANFYLNNTTDVNKTFKKYKHFDYIKVITRRDVYDIYNNDNSNSNSDDMQVLLYDYYNKGLITKKEFISNFNQPNIFLSSCIPWNEFLSLFTTNYTNQNRTIRQLDTMLNNLNTSISKKSFDFKEYHDLYKKTKIGIIINYFLPFKH